MARIAGVDLPRRKHVRIALTYIFGVGHTKAVEICEKSGVPGNKRVEEMSRNELVEVAYIQQAQLDQVRRNFQSVVEMEKAMRRAGERELAK